MVPRVGGSNPLIHPSSFEVVYLEGSVVCDYEMLDVFYTLAGIGSAAVSMFVGPSDVLRGRGH